MQDCFLKECFSLPDKNIPKHAFNCKLAFENENVRRLIARELPQFCLSGLIKKNSMFALAKCHGVCIISVENISSNALRNGESVWKKCVNMGWSLHQSLSQMITYRECSCYPDLNLASLIMTILTSSRQCLAHQQKCLPTSRKCLPFSSTETKT